MGYTLVSEMGKQDSSWRRVGPVSASVVKFLLIVSMFGQVASGNPISETLQRALSAVRGPSPGAKKLLNIPEDGGEFVLHISLNTLKVLSISSFFKHKIMSLRK